MMPATRPLAAKKSRGQVCTAMVPWALENVTTLSSVENRQAKIMTSAMLQHACLARACEGSVKGLTSSLGISAASWRAALRAEMTIVAAPRMMSSTMPPQSSRLIANCIRMPAAYAAPAPVASLGSSWNVNAKVWCAAAPSRPSPRNDMHPRISSASVPAGN